MPDNYTQVFQDEQAADKYDNIVYAPGSYSSAIDGRQRRWLRQLITREFATPPAHHDFACGTGRVILALRGSVSQSYGYDTSQEMLDRAHRAAPEADLNLVAAAGPLPAPASTDQPAIVTVFRLLLNAPSEVRDRAIAFAAQLLPDADAGLLVLENHGNRRSLRHLARRRRHEVWFAELGDAEVREHLARHGFDLVERRGFALFPPGSYQRGWLRGLARRIDDWASRQSWLAPICTDVLYVARRSA